MPRITQVLEHYSPEQIAARLSVDTHTIYRWKREQKLTGWVKLGRLVRLPADRLAAFLDARRIS